MPEKYKNKNGDVVVFDKTTNHENGHIAMFDGDQWISDFKQNDMWGGSIRKEAPSYKIYRNPLWQE
jgi:hypothetical protein